MQYLAHLFVENDGPEIEQTLLQHNISTAEIAESVLLPAGMSAAAYLAGFLHDIGKYTAAYQEYLVKSARGDPDAPPKGSICHTFAAVRYILQRWHSPPQDMYHRLTAELLAYAAGAHHGSFDLAKDDGPPGFQHRLTDESFCYQEVLTGFRQEIPEVDVDALFAKACVEIKSVFDCIFNAHPKQLADLLMGLGLTARLLQSAVMEGDRRDTRAFKRRKPPDKVIRPDWEGALRNLEDRLGSYPRDTPVNRIRAEISDRCAEAAQQPGGIIRLTVPTGGGKTLSSLRYALTHAARYNKRRIFYVMPLLAIIEQNAEAIRNTIGDVIPVLEHHSNVVQTDMTYDELDEHELLCESWQAPIIVTTLVQFLQTLFSGRTTCIRRMQALCGSIIILDEVQTVPVNMLSLFNSAIQFLAEVCRATVILCSATQPCLETIEHPLPETREMIDEDLTQRPELKRTAIRYLGEMSREQLADWSVHKLEQVDSLLIICNTRRDARAMYRLLNEACCPVIHISAGMCHAHRSDVMERITSLKPGEKLICVSTQVMEAGVDVSFDCVVRVAAGVDSVVQAAGRCNRHGEYGDVRDVYIVRLHGEKLGSLEIIKDSIAALTELLEEYRLDPDRFDNDLASASAVAEYYRVLYRELKDKETEYCLKHVPDSLYGLLSQNDRYTTKDGYIMHQAFKLAGSLFTVFDTDTVSVVVPYGDGEVLIDKLCALGPYYDQDEAVALLERAKPYTVNLYRTAFNKLMEKGAIRTAKAVMVHCLMMPFYDDTGVVDQVDDRFLEG